MGLLDWVIPPNPYKLEKKKDVDGLLKALSYRLRATIRRQAADALGELGGGRAVEPLVRAMDDAQADVRAAAAAALGRLGDARALGRLISALSDAGVQVRLRSIEALGKLGDDRAIEPLLGCLDASDNELVLAARSSLQGWKKEERVNQALEKAEASLIERRRGRAEGWWKGRSSAKCDACSGAVAKSSGYLLDSCEMVSSRAYIRYAVSLRKTIMRASGGLSVPGLSTSMTDMLFDPILEVKVIWDVRGTATPWLVCEGCYQRYFRAQA